MSTVLFARPRMLQSGQTTSSASSSVPLPWSLVWAKLALGTYTWALLTPLILLASRRWYIERRNLSRNVLIHFLLSFAFASAQTFLYHLGLTLIEPAGWGASGVGVGLSNMRARLKYLYGLDQRLELLSRDGGGTTASVRLPFREDHKDAHDAREAVMFYRHV